MDYKYIILISISLLWICYDVYRENYHLSEFLFFLKNLIISNFVMIITLSLPILKIIGNKMYNHLIPIKKISSSNVSFTFEILIFYLFVLILLIKRKFFNKIVTNPVFYVIIWLAEISLRRNYYSSWKFNLLILFSLNIYLNEEYVYHNNIHLAFKQNLEGLIKYNYSIISFGFILTLSILSTLNKIFVNYYELHRPAKKIYTKVTFSSNIIWYLVTFFDILISNLFQTKTIACIYICFEQWRRFKQVRSIFPTLVFTTLEISYQMRKQIFLRKKQLEINNISTFFSKMDSPEKILNEKKENLEIGDFIVVKPNNYSPCTFIILGLMKENKIIVNKNNRPIEVIINTKSIDGETNDKMKFSCDNISEIKKILYQSNNSSNYIIKNKYIIRNGSYISKYNKNSVIGKIINFENINNNFINYQKDFLDLFIITINRFSISCLLLITASFSFYNLAYNSSFDFNIVVDIMLMNNILIPMTLPAFLVFIVNNLKINSEYNIYKEKGKRSLINLIEKSFRNNKNVIKGIHCTDKTGTLTQNSMNFICSYCLENKKLINPNSKDNEELIEKHISITQNTPQSPRMVAEEYEYTKSFEVTLKKISRLKNNWELVEYILKKKHYSVERLFLGFFKKHKSVFSIIKKDSDYQIVIQGPPDTMKNLTGLSILKNTNIPNLNESLLLANEYWNKNFNNDDFPEGCQRNWIIGWSSYFKLNQENISLLEHISEKKNNITEVVRKQFNLFINQFKINPKKYLILIDKWRKGSKEITKYLNKLQFSFWILTGDNLENSVKIARSLNCNTKFIIINPNITEKTQFLNNIINEMELCKQPATIFINNDHQTILKNIDIYSKENKKITKYLKIYLTGICQFQVVCYSSEKETKGFIVNYIKKNLSLETIYTGDGKNDVSGFENSTISICFPNDRKYDPELSAISDINADNNFWIYYTNNMLFSEGLKIWKTIYVACILSISKQSITAGMSFGLSYITNFKKMEDPYDPFLYQFFQLFSFITILIFCLKCDINIKNVRHFVLKNIIINYIIFYIIGFINVIIVFHFFGNNNKTNIYSLVFSYFSILISCICYLSKSKY